MVRDRNKISNLKSLDNHMIVKIANGHNLEIKELGQVDFFKKKNDALYVSYLLFVSKINKD